MCSSSSFRLLKWVLAGLKQHKQYRKPKDGHKCKASIATFRLLQACGIREIDVPSSNNEVTWEEGPSLKKHHLEIYSPYKIETHPLPIPQKNHSFQHRYPTTIQDPKPLYDHLQSSNWTKWSHEPNKSTNIMMMMMMKRVKKALLFHPLLLKNMVFPKPWIMTYVWGKLCGCIHFNI